MSHKHNVIIRTQKSVRETKTSEFWYWRQGDANRRYSGA